MQISLKKNSIVHKFTSINLFNNLIPVDMNGKPVLLGVILNRESWGLGIEGKVKKMAKKKEILHRRVGKDKGR